VSDLETSARFYTEELGLDRVAQSPPEAVVFATTPIPFGLTFAFEDPDGYIITIHG
jgi:catechol 2,3-dioxygenase-like lactoylglutathione lyase family enzyme